MDDESGDLAFSSGVMTAAPTRGSTVGGPKCSVWPISGSQTIFERHEVPHERNIKEGKPIVLGLQFQAEKEGDITAFRYFRVAEDKSTRARTGRIYSWPDGKQLGNTATFTDTNCPGNCWISVPLLKPIHVVPGKVYVVAIDNLDVYPRTTGYLTKEKRNGHLIARTKGGVYGYTANIMPKQQAGNGGDTNYWVDGKSTAFMETCDTWASAISLSHKRVAEE